MCWLQADPVWNHHFPLLHSPFVDSDMLPERIHQEFSKSEIIVSDEAENSEDKDQNWTFDLLTFLYNGTNFGIE